MPIAKPLLYCNCGSFVAAQNSLIGSKSAKFVRISHQGSPPIVGGPGLLAPLYTNSQDHGRDLDDRAPKDVTSRAARDARDA